MARPDAVLDPTSAPCTGAAAVASEQRIFVASQWQLMWWRFRKHKVAVASALVVIGFYLVVVGADFLAYADPERVRGAALAHASAAHSLVRRRALRPVRPRGSRAPAIPRASSASIARTPTRRSPSGSSPRASSTGSWA